MIPRGNLLQDRQSRRWRTGDVQLCKDERPARKGVLVVDAQNPLDGAGPGRVSPRWVRAGSSRFNPNSIENLPKSWAAVSEAYRLSVAYKVTDVQIDSRRP
jgi:hypothetical protein